jgi:hypothetical protein
LPSLSTWQADKLRRALTAFDGTNERLSALLDFMLQDLSALSEAEWQKAQRRGYALGAAQLHRGAGQAAAGLARAAR